MCSVAEDEFDELKVMEKYEPLLKTDNTPCKKCKIQNADVILRKKDPYCNECFLGGVVHKFRASLGKTKLIRKGDRVLIAFSGDAASSALMNLVVNGLKEDNHKRLRFEPVALYIDEGAINLSNEERLKKSSYLLSQAQLLDMKMTVASISDVLAEDNSVSLVSNDNLVIDNEKDVKIKAIFDSVTSMTAKQDLLKKLRKTLLVKYAEAFNCAFVFVADTATSLAADLLVSLSLGAGSNLATEIGFCDDRYNTVKILKPMRDFTSDDLELFVRINKISHIAHTPLVGSNNHYSSIQSLTRKFVTDLQNDFPATIPTVLRIGDKVENKTSAEIDSEENQCALCQSLLDTEAVPCSALQATEFSREMSNRIIDDDLSTGQNRGAENACKDCTCKSTSTGDKTLTRREIEQFLCYSCRLIMRDVQDLSSLPPPFMSSIRYKRSLRDIRNNIQDFLL